MAFGVDGGVAILEDHEAGRFAGVVLVWEVDPIVALSAGEDFGRVEAVLGKGAGLEGSREGEEENEA